MHDDQQWYIEGMGISANRHLDHSSSAAVISQETEGEKKILHFEVTCYLLSGNTTL